MTGQSPAQRPAHSDDDVSASSRSQTIAPLIALLHQLKQVVSELSSQQYQQDMEPDLPGTVGGHVRHCLDHVAAVVSGATWDVVDYDQRERGTAVQYEPAEALHAIDHLIEQLRGYDTQMLTQSTTVRTMTCAGRPGIEMTSSLGREFAFVISHTVHHQAIIATVLRAMDQPVPEGFGIAPSTQAWLNEAASRGR